MARLPAPLPCCPHHTGPHLRRRAPRSVFEACPFPAPGRPQLSFCSRRRAGPLSELSRLRALGKRACVPPSGRSCWRSVWTINHCAEEMPLSWLAGIRGSSGWAAGPSVLLPWASRPARWRGHGAGETSGFAADRWTLRPTGATSSAEAPSTSPRSSDEVALDSLSRARCPASSLGGGTCRLFSPGLAQSHGELMGKLRLGEVECLLGTHGHGGGDLNPGLSEPPQTQASGLPSQPCVSGKVTSLGHSPSFGKCEAQP